MTKQLTRNHKDTLFQMAFKDNPEAALSLYNAVNDSNYQEADKLRFELLAGGIFMRMENDNGFVVDQSLNLYEHQSTINPNMPLRGLFYFADLYRELIPKHRRLYQRTLIKIPVPKYVVFYNGQQDMKEDVRYLRLSDAFERTDETNGYEWTAKMLNVNAGHNEKLMNSCKMLREYTYFIDKVRSYGCETTGQNAIMRAMKECIEANIFKEVLLKYQTEIEKMSFLEFDEEEFVRLVREEAIEEERVRTEKERVRADAAEEKASIAEEKANIAEEKANIAEEKANIAQALVYQTLIESVRDFGGTQEIAMQRLIEKHPECESLVETLIAKYW